MRDLQGFAETRRTLLTIKPNNKNNWIGFAMAQHLCTNYNTALKVIDTYDKTQEPSSEPNYEDSEVLLYRNQIIMESGNLEKALTHLEEIEPLVVDKFHWRQTKATLLCRSEQYEQAKEEFLTMLKMNTENFEYHLGLQNAVLETSDYFELTGCDLPSSVIDLTESQCSTLQALYQELAEQYPRSSAIKRIPLNFLTGDTFRAVLDKYVSRQLVKGIPCLASDLKQLYANKTTGKISPEELANDDNVKIMGDLFSSYVVSLKSTSKFPGASAESVAEGPTVVMWAMFLVAQHHYHFGQYEKALELTKECIAHTPTAIDVLQFQAKIYKQLGDTRAAAAMMETGRKLDLADRFTNNKACKYFLRSDQLEKAESTVGLFTRHEGDQDVTASLFEMQCMWYELECGASHYRLKDYGNALKKFMAVEKHFIDFQEDQFDFHTYCIRKMTLRAYLQMLRMEDKLWSHKFYNAAAKAAVQCYLDVFDRPKELVAGVEAADYEKMDPAEKKKAKAKVQNWIF